MTQTIKVITPEGILDGTKATNFRSQIDRSVSEGVEVILVDFSDVTFMDSSGLGALVLALKTIRGAGLTMFLCSINEQIKMLFELTSMDRVFEIFPSKEEFEQNFSQRSEANTTKSQLAK